MKKNRLFVLGLVTVFVALVSLTFVSSTWAKYTTTAAGSDTARVAYWGFNDTTSMDITELFSDTYDAVKGKSTDVIAPGTQGQATFKFSYTVNNNASVGAPEVDYVFTVDTSQSSIGSDINANPNIDWKLDNGEWGSFDALLSQIKALSGDASGTKEYEAGYLPSAFTGAEHTIYWVWRFAEDDASNTTDTNMGNAESLQSVTISIKVTATQVDN